MSRESTQQGVTYSINKHGVACLFAALRKQGYLVVGPTVRDGAIVLDILEDFEELPSGWTDEQAPGTYRLKRNGDGALFQYVVGPQSFKARVHPPEVRLFEIERRDGQLRVVGEDPAPARYAFFGMRACDIAALAVLDRVLEGDKYKDTVYERRRQENFVVAVNCTRAADTCFCASMNTGPRVEWGFDIALTELLEQELFLVEAGSERGAKVMDQMFQSVERQEASAEDRELGELLTQRVAAGMKRKVDTKGLRDALCDNLEHPEWDAVARRCLLCANCTMVCPTCFCTAVEDTSDVTGTKAERWRRMDSCYSLMYSYIHGGSVRQSGKARYRQWMTHKLASWVDQFGTLGCVGCGRCITWCPAGIDITEEAAIIRQQSAAPATLAS